MLTNVKIDNVDDFLRRVDQHRAGSAQVELDLKGVRIERPAASVLSAALLSAWGDVPLVVQLPPGESRRALPSLTFAFANRRGRTEVPGVDLQPWRRSWSPGMRERMGLLFSPAQMGETNDEPSIFGRYHASFINPHRAAHSTGTSAVTLVVRPWLADVLPEYLSKPRDQRANPQFINDMGRLIDELLENVREHASPHGGDNAVRSLVQIEITRGSEDRLHLIVLDTGPGIVVTARPKVADMMLSDDALLGALLQGSLTGWHRGRGRGLPDVWKAVSSWSGSSLYVASNKVRLSGVGGALTTHSDGFDLHGTVIAATFPLPPVHLN